MTEPDFSEWLHGLRTKRLQGLPPGAKVVLSGGANARWYFEWFEEQYRGDVERHIGVEALAPKPDDLPEHVEWVASSLGDLSAVPSGTVDLIFAGEVIEHLWPEDIAGFLLEAHRVLAPGGHLALDSPNRRVTEAIGWLHPEHTLELSVDEIAELLTAAGFDEIEISGIVLAYDRAAHRFLPIEPIEVDGFSSEQRAEGANDNPEDAFVWWAQARRADREPDAALVRQRVLYLFSQFRTRRLQQLNSAVGTVVDVPHEGRFVHSGVGAAGPLIYGPYVAMPAGEWDAAFELQLPAGAVSPPQSVVAALEVVTDGGTTVLAVAEIPASAVAHAPAWSRHGVRFSLPRTTMGLEFRLSSRGVVPLVARFAVDVTPPRPASPKPAAAEPAGPQWRMYLPLGVRKALGRVRRRLGLSWG